MAQELLYHPEIGPSIEEMGGKGVAQHMGMNTTADSGGRRIFSQ